MVTRRPRTVLRATALAAALAFGAALPAAYAQPPADPETQYRQLSAEAAKTDEDLLKAKDDLVRRTTELNRAGADESAAIAAQAAAATAVERARVDVDRFAAASFQNGAGQSRMAAMLGSGSTQAFLDRMSALSVLATDHQRALDTLTTALRQADAARAEAQGARERAADAREAAATLTAQIEAHKSTLDRQIAQVRQALSRLSSAQKTNLGTVKDTGSYLGPAGAANTALQAAVAKRGSAYEWGAEGPSEFDCSGLMMWAFRAAGISLPHSSRSQYTLGRPVSKDQLQPGDLVFFDDGSGDPSAIHHVGMYVGSGKMVDAPTEGQVVDVRSATGDGHYIGARRLVG